MPLPLSGESLIRLKPCRISSQTRQKRHKTSLSRPDLKKTLAPEIHGPLLQQVIQRLIMTGPIAEKIGPSSKIRGLQIFDGFFIIGLRSLQGVFEGGVRRQKALHDPHRRA